MAKLFCIAKERARQGIVSKKAALVRLLTGFAMSEDRARAIAKMAEALNLMMKGRPNVIISERDRIAVANMLRDGHEPLQAAYHVLSGRHLLH